jgi:hypothetical protein
MDWRRASIENRERFRRCVPVPNRGTWGMALAALLTAGTAQPSVIPSEQQSPSDLNTITVEAERQRATLEQQVKAFVSAIAVAPNAETLARWQEPTRICTLVAGLPHEEGEFILSRLSNIAAAAGAPVGPAHCKPNFYVIVTSQPDAILKAWSQRDTTMFGEGSGSKIRKFLAAPTPIRVWYNAALYTSEGTPLAAEMPGTGISGGSPTGILSGFPINTRAMNFRLTRDEVRDLTSVIVLIDANRLKGVTFGQLAAYISMIGLAEVRLDAKMGDAPSILQLFSASGNIPPLGLSPWDQAFIKALYRTQHTDPTQLSAIKTAMVEDIAP